jgi:transketolase
MFLKMEVGFILLKNNMRKQFVNTISNMLSKDDNLCLLLGDIGVFGFKECFNQYPDRVYNIGILEQSTISLAAGMSKANMIPVVHTIAPFIVERALEQLKDDFGYQNLNGNFISIGNSYDYAGLGCTHHCPSDVSVLSTIPNMQIISPGNSYEFDSLFNQTYSNGAPTYFRLSEYEHNLDFKVEFGKANVIQEGSKALIICYGNMLKSVYDAVKNLDVTLLYYSTITPFDSETLRKYFVNNIIVCEPFYEGSTNYLINKSLEGVAYKLTNIGIPREFILNYGKKHQIDEIIGLDIESIKTKINKLI